MRAACLAACAVLGGCITIDGPPPPRSAAYADFLIGRVADSRDDHAAAADRFFAALARAPEDQALQAGALASSISIADFNRARHAARLAPRDGGPALAYILRSADALRAGNWRRANAEIERTEGSAAEELIARMLQVWARTGEGRVDDVLVELEALAAMRPYGGLFAYQQAMALDWAGRREAALRAYEIGARGGLWLPAGVERHADLLARSGARDRAIALLSDPAASRANPALAQALVRAERGEAIAADTLTPARGAAISLQGLAAIFVQEHDRSNALIATALALALRPDFDAAWLSFAEAHSALRHYDFARSVLENVPSSSPYAASANAMAAWALLDAGRQDEALARVEIAAASGDARGVRALADMYRRLQRYDEAEQVYSRLIESEPGNWRFHFARGAARERLGRWPEAEADMRRALELSPDQPDVLNYLGYTWADRGEHLSEALAMLQRAVALRPTSAAIIDSLGWVHYRMGDYAQAQRYLERAVELDPADATLNDHLGDVYWRLGRRIEARFQWRRALTLEPDDAAAIEAKIEGGLPPAPAARSATR